MHAIRRNRSLTGGDQDQGSPGVDDASSGREDRSSAVLDGLVDAPVEARRLSRSVGADQFSVSMEKLRLSDRACLHPRYRSSELSGVGTTECQLAILLAAGCRGLKRHCNLVNWDSSLAEKVVRDSGDRGLCIWRQRPNGQVDRSDPLE